MPPGSLHWTFEELTSSTKPKPTNEPMALFQSHLSHYGMNCSKHDLENNAIYNTQHRSEAIAVHPTALCMKNGSLLQFINSLALVFSLYKFHYIITLYHHNSLQTSMRTSFQLFVAKSWKWIYIMMAHHTYNAFHPWFPRLESAIRKKQHASTEIIAFQQLP